MATKRRKPGGETGRKYDPPVSLYPLSLEEAVDKLLSAKPEPSTTKSRQKKGPPGNPT